MATATELNTATELYYTYTVTVLLTEQSYGTEFLGFFHRYVTMILQSDILADTTVHNALYLAEFLRSNLLEVREVKAEIIGSNE